MESQTIDDATISSRIIKFSDNDPNHYNSQPINERSNSQNQKNETLNKHTQPNLDQDEDEKTAFQQPFIETTIPLINLLSPTTKSLFNNLLGISKEEKNPDLKKELDEYQKDLDKELNNHHFNIHHFPMTPKLTSEYSMVKTLISPTQSENLQFLDKNKRFENIQSARKPKIAYFDVTKLKSSESLQKERLEQIQNENNFLKEQLNYYVQRCEEFVNQLKEGEEKKSKGITLAKKYDEQLKSLNRNYALLQKKVAGLEKEKKEFGDSLKLIEAEKKSLLEKNQRLLKKIKAEDIHKINSKVISKEMEEIFEKFFLMKSELQIVKESERSYKRMHMEQTQMVKYLNEKYETDSREKDFLLTKNIEMIERIGKLQQIIKANQTKHQNKNDNENLPENNTLQELQTTIHLLEQEKTKLLKTIEELTSKNDELKTIHHESLKESELKMTFGSYNENQSDAFNEVKDCKIENVIENIDLSSSTYITREDSEYQPICISFENQNNEDLSSVLIEFEEKLSKDDYQNLLNIVRNYVDSIRESFKSNQIVNKYNKLLVHYLQALDKIRALEKPNTIQLQKVENDISRNETISTSPTRGQNSDSSPSLNPFRYRPFQPMTKVINNPLVSPLAVKDSKRRSVSFIFGDNFSEIKRNLSNNQNNSKFFIEAPIELFNVNPLKSPVIDKLRLLTKSLQKDSPKVSPIKNSEPKALKKCSDLNVTDLFNFQSTPIQKTSLPRPRSTPKTTKSYREMYVQRKKENSIAHTHYTDRSFGETKGF